MRAVDCARPRDQVLDQLATGSPRVVADPARELAGQRSGLGAVAVPRVTDLAALLVEADQGGALRLARRQAVERDQDTDPWLAVPQRFSRRSRFESAGTGVVNRCFGPYPWGHWRCGQHPATEPAHCPGQVEDEAQDPKTQTAERRHAEPSSPRSAAGAWD